MHQEQFASSTSLVFQIVVADVFQFLHVHEVKEYSRLQIRRNNYYWRDRSQTHSYSYSRNGKSRMGNTTHYAVLQEKVNIVNWFLQMTF